MDQPKIWYAYETAKKKNIYFPENFRFSNRKRVICSKRKKWGKRVGGNNNPKKFTFIAKHKNLKKTI